MPRVETPGLPIKAKDLGQKIPKPFFAPIFRLLSAVFANPAGLRSVVVRLLALSLIAWSSAFAEPPPPKGALIFSDDFERAELGSAWRITPPEFTIADGVLKAVQTQPHSAVGMVKVGCKDVTVEFRFRLLPNVSNRP